MARRMTRCWEHDKLAVAEEVVFAFDLAPGDRVVKVVLHISGALVDGRPICEGQFGALNIYLSLRKEADSASMVVMQVRLDDMPNVFGRDSGGFREGSLRPRRVSSLSSKNR